MTSEETTENKSLSLDTVTEGVKQEESAPAVEESVLEEAQEETPQVDMNSLDVAENAEEVAAEDIAPEAAEVEMNIAEDDMPAPAPAAAAAPALVPASAPPMEEGASLDNAPVPLAVEPEQEEAHAQYYMKNALYDIPSQKTADGMAPIKGATPPMKEELLSEESLGEMAVDQMNKRLESQQKLRLGKRSPEPIKTTRGVNLVEKTVPVTDSYATLRKSLLQDNKFPQPDSVNVEQWLKYFGVSELANTTEGADNKDAQFAKAVNQFGKLLLKGETANVNAYDEVLEMLKDSVGNDEKRLEFKSIVEKAVMLSILK